MVHDTIKEMIKESKKQGIKSNYTCMTIENYNKLMEELIENKSVDSEEYLLIDGRRFEANKLEDDIIEIHLFN